MKWIGLEWKKRREIGEKKTPQKLTFSRKHIKHISKKKRRHFSGKKKPRRDTTQLANRWVGGAGPGPNRNKIGQIWSK